MAVCWLGFRRSLCSRRNGVCAERIHEERWAAGDIYLIGTHANAAHLSPFYRVRNTIPRDALALSGNYSLVGHLLYHGPKKTPLKNSGVFKNVCYGIIIDCKRVRRCRPGGYHPCERLSSTISRAARKCRG